MPQARAMLMFDMVLDLLQKEGFLEVCKYASSRKWILLHLASLGTDYLLKEQSRYTEMAATVAFVFLSVEALKDEPVEHDVGVRTRDLVEGEMRDLAEGGDRDIVRFFSKRITCSCLKEKYKQLKSEPKLGSCTNCKQRKERRKLMVCALCRLPQYCSKACQEAHWPEHKVCCDLHMKNKKK